MTRALLVLCLSSAAACTTREPLPATADEAPPASIVVRDPSGGERVRYLLPGADPATRRITVSVPGSPPVVVSVEAGGDLVARSAGALVARASRAQGGLLVTSGNDRLRVVPAAGRITILDGLGVAVLTIEAEPGASPGTALGYDPAGRPARRARPEGGRILLEDAQGGRLGTVHGPARPDLALLLSADPLPPAVRAAIALHLLD